MNNSQNKLNSKKVSKINHAKRILNKTMSLCQINRSDLGKPNDSDDVILSFSRIISPNDHAIDPLCYPLNLGL